MKDEKGRFAAGNTGRPAGTPNKTTNKIREAFQNLIEANLENMTIWLTQVAADDPKGALDLLNKMAWLNASMGLFNRLPFCKSRQVSYLSATILRQLA